MGLFVCLSVLFLSWDFGHWPNLKNKQTCKQTVIFTLSFIYLAAVLSKMTFKWGTPQHKQQPVSCVLLSSVGTEEHTPVVSLSLCCLVGGSSVSHGVDWLMGVWPHLTPGANRRLGVCVSPGERPAACKERIHMMEIRLHDTKQLLSTQYNASKAFSVVYWYFTIGAHTMNGPCE